MQKDTVRGSNNDCIITFRFHDFDVLCDVGMLSHCPWFW